MFLNIFSFSSMSFWFFLPIDLRNLLANVSPPLAISGSIIVFIINSCVSIIPVLDNKCFSIRLISLLSSPYSLISLYHSLMSFLYLTNLSTGCSPLSTCKRMIVFVTVNSSNVSGLIFLIAFLATKLDIWKASNISPSASISYIPLLVKSRTSG